MGVLYLTEDDVARLVDIRTAVDAVEEAFKQLAAGEATDTPRQRATAPGIVLHSMSAGAAYLGLVGWKNYTTTRKGARFLVGLSDQESGELIALIEASRLGQLRTGATSAVATSWMANREVSELGMFGAGYQAETQLAATLVVRQIKQAFIYSRDPDKRAAFCQRMSEQLGIDVTAVDRPSEAAEDLPLVITATSSREPVFDGEWLAEGTHVCAMGSNWLSRAEIDVTTVRRADHICCDSITSCRHEAGDFVPPLEAGVFEWSDAVNLADVVTGRAVGRSRTDEITLFKSVGMALEDVALGAKVVELARQEGLGRELDL